MMNQNEVAKGWPGLYVCQRIAVDKMHNGCILKGGVGSGKSITSLAYYYNKVCEGDIDSPKYSKLPSARPPNLYIITTAKKRDSMEWEEEMHRFQLTGVVDSWNNIKKYKAVRNAFFIFDEDRVTGTGAWSHSFLRIAEHNKWILLSATPGDIWLDYAVVFIANGYFKNITEFKRQHVIYSPYVTKYPKIDGYYNEGKLRMIRDELEVNIDLLRSTKRHDLTLNVGFDREAYKAAVITRWDPFLNEPIENISRLCSILRRISNNVSERVDYIRKLMDKFSIDRVIIFYNFNYELDGLHQLDGFRGCKLAEWNGHKHEKIPAGKKWIYLVNYKSGSEGWNCTSTDSMIFFSQTYSYKELEQAKGRIDRANTPYRDLYYYHFVSKSAIDKTIQNALREKKLFNENTYAKKIGW